VVGAYRYARGRWTGPAGGDLRIDPDRPIAVEGGDRLCLATTHRFVSRARCLTGNRWELLGGLIGRPGRFVTIDGLVTAGMGRFALLHDVSGRHVSGPGIVGRNQDRVYQLQAGGWAEVGAGMPFPSGSQRAAGFALGGQICVAADVLGGTPSVGVRCLSSGRWEAPFFEIPSSRSAFDQVDGVASLGQRVFLGLDHFKHTGVDWPVVSAVGGKPWTRTRLGAATGEWDEQGEILSAAQHVLAMRFDQRRAAGRVLGRIVVTEFDPHDLGARQLGPPLLRRSPLLGTVSFDLAIVKNTLFALYTRPNPGEHRSELIVRRTNDF
jgi:hypothetical protein